MSLEVHVRICESLRVRFLWATRLVITGKSPELLKEKVIPIVIESLKEIGLELSQEKSKITHIDQGFDFLGFKNLYSQFYPAPSSLFKSSIECAIITVFSAVTTAIS